MRKCGRVKKKYAKIRTAGRRLTGEAASRRLAHDYGTPHRTAPSRLRKRKDEPAAVGQEPGGGCGGRGSGGGRGRQRIQGHGRQPHLLSGGRLRQDARLLRGSTGHEG